MTQSLRPYDVILFDGVCNFCNSAVNFILQKDRNERFRFASLQSAFGNQVLESAGLPVDDYDSFVLLSGTEVYTRSTAAIKVLESLPAPWCYLKILKIVPRQLRDIIYGLIARNRYRIFGKSEICRIATPEEKERFLD